MKIEKVSGISAVNPVKNNLISTGKQDSKKFREALAEQKKGQRKDTFMRYNDTSNKDEKDREERE